jgi:uncharacterized protein with GYD domain
MSGATMALGVAWRAGSRVAAVGCRAKECIGCRSLAQRCWAAGTDRRKGAASIGEVEPGPRQCKGSLMFTYVGLLQFTEKGLHGVKDTTKRAAAAKEAARKSGVHMREILWTQGEFDMVCILEAENEAALAAFSLGIAQQGNVRTRSLRAYPAAEMDKILALLK